MKIAWRVLEWVSFPFLLLGFTMVFFLLLLAETIDRIALGRRGDRERWKLGM